MFCMSTHDEAPSNDSNQPNRRASLDHEQIYDASSIQPCPDFKCPFDQVRSRPSIVD